MELHGENTRGQMVIEKRPPTAREATPPPNVDVIESVDVERVCHVIFSAFGCNKKGQ